VALVGDSDCSQDGGAHRPILPADGATLTIPVRGELLKLGITVSNRSIRRYRWRDPGRRPSQAWCAFLVNHAPTIWAADLLTVQTLAFMTLYVLLFISHGRREPVHPAATAHPTAA
jgi:hypothetical protein